MEFNIFYKYASSFYILFVISIIGLAYIIDKGLNKYIKEEKIFNFKSTLRGSIPKKGIIYTYVNVVFFGIYIFVLLVSFLSIFLSKYFDYFNNALSKIVDFEGVCLAFTAIVISAVVFTKTLSPRDYYLIYSHNDILNKYKIGFVYHLIGLSCIISIICTALLLEYNLNYFIDQMIFLLYQSAIIVLWGFGSYALYIVGKVSFSNNMFELKMLNRLYEIFWNNTSVNIINDKEIAINVNLEYLLINYEKSINHPTFNNIENIRYESICDNKKWYNVAKIIVVRFGILIFIFSNALFIIVNQNKDKFVHELIIELVINTLILLTGYIFLSGKIISKSIGNFLIKLVLDRKGYYIELKSKKVIFVGDVSIYRNIYYENYIHRFTNIMAFYYIICRCIKDNESIKNSFSDMIDFMKENEYKICGKFEKSLYYMPVMASGFFYFVSEIGKDDFPEVINNLYKEINLSEEDENKYHRILNSFVVNACKYRPNYKDIKAKRDGIDTPNYYEDYIGQYGYWQKVKSRN